MFPPILQRARPHYGLYLYITTIACLATQVLSQAQSAEPKNCRIVPSDLQWPSTQEWAELNKTVDGRLIATVPIGAPCFKKTYDVTTQQYDLSTYDEAACANVKTNWIDPVFHEPSSSSAMATYFAKGACNPFNTSVDAECEIGGYVQYAIDVGGDDHVRAGLAFAQKHNIRILVRNTGHE